MKIIFKSSAKSMILFVLFIVSPQRPFAQPNPAEKDDIEARRIGFITKELQLTSEEAQVFWPVYSRYHQELETLRKSRATELTAAQINFDSYSDEQVNKVIASEFDYRQKELDLQRRYDTEFKKVLPVKKVARLYRAEQLFKIYLIKEGKPAKPGGSAPSNKK